MKVHLSLANQAETATNPKDVNAVKTVVIMEVTLPWKHGIVKLLWFDSEKTTYLATGICKENKSS